MVSTARDAGRVPTRVWPHRESDWSNGRTTDGATSIRRQFPGRALDRARACRDRVHSGRRARRLVGSGGFVTSRFYPGVIWPGRIDWRSIGSGVLGSRFVGAACSLTCGIGSGRIVPAESTSRGWPPGADRTT